MKSLDTQPLRAKLFELQARHRQLDDKIASLQEFPYVDQLQVRRLKRQKLSLKEIIERLKNELIPDLNA